MQKQEYSRGYTKFVDLQNKKPDQIYQNFIFAMTDVIITSK